MTLVVPLGFGALLLSGSAGEGSSHALLGSAVAALAAFYGLPSERGRTHTPFRLGDAIARYRLVLSNPRSFVCYGVVFLEGGAIYGITPFIGDLLQARGAGDRPPMSGPGSMLVQGWSGRHG
jgi:hypothetical protein